MTPSCTACRKPSAVRSTDTSTLRTPASVGLGRTSRPPRRQLLEPRGGQVLAARCRDDAVVGRVRRVAEATVTIHESDVMLAQARKVLAGPCRAAA